jgi:nicotinate-nucleotide pyrophosphorylase (carboxylating)
VTHNLKALQILISNAIREDVGDGDHSSMACIQIQPRYSKIISDDGIIAGVEFAINDISLHRS